MARRLVDTIGRLPAHHGAECSEETWRPLFHRAFEVLHSQWAALGGAADGAQRAEAALEIAGVYHHYFLRTGDRTHAAMAAKFYGAALVQLGEGDKGAKRVVDSACTAMLLLDGRVRIPAHFRMLIDPEALRLGACIAPLAAHAAQKQYRTRLEGAVIVSNSESGWLGTSCGAFVFNAHLNHAASPICRVFLSRPTYAQLAAAVAGMSLECPARIVLYVSGDIAFGGTDDAWSLWLPCGRAFRESSLLAIRPDAERTAVVLDALGGPNFMAGCAMVRSSMSADAAATELISSDAGQFFAALHTAQ